MFPLLALHYYVRGIVVGKTGAIVKLSLCFNVFHLLLLMVAAFLIAFLAREVKKNLFTV